VVRALLIALVACGVLAFAAGCGDDKPKQSVTAYLNAVADDDNVEACKHLTEHAQEQALEKFSNLSPKDCPDVVHKVVVNIFGADAEDLKDASTSDKSESGDTATVEASLDGRTVDVPLRKEDGEWKLDAAGVAAQLLGKS
jgi:hypothetical protein